MGDQELQMERMFASLTNYVHSEIKNAFGVVKRNVSQDFKEVYDKLQEIEERIDTLESAVAALKAQERRPQKKQKVVAGPSFFDARENYPRVNK